VSLKAEIIGVELQPYSPLWVEMAREESERLAGELGDLLLKVEHMGSTAIPGIAAKPIIDLIPISHHEAAHDEI
jgi:GrpB-like predicted nucleotidyltransferase (UPF0157 family)